MELVAPTAAYKLSFLEAVKEFAASDDTNERKHRYAEYANEISARGFDAFVESEAARAQGEGLPEGYVPETTLWLIDAGEFIGRVSIRHTLNDHLRKVGGHIGYDIRPSKRMQGYGTKILERALPHAKRLGIDCVLVTCDATNEGSRRIIEKNGGILENEEVDENGNRKLRFWIENK